MSTTNKTSTKTSAASKPHAPIPQALASTGIAEALAELQALDNRRHLMPAAAREDLLSVARRVVDAAEELGLRNAAELVTEHTLLLKALTGVDKPQQFQKTAVAEQLHTYRNMMLTLAVAATSFFHGDPTGLYQRMVKLTPRTHRLRRPLTDDEILLARVVIHLESTTQPRSPRAAVYTLVEAGMTPGETTLFKLEDADDYEMPSLVLAAGNAHVQSRFLPLDRFNTVVLGRFTEAAHRAGIAATKPLTYQGRKHAAGSSAATASAQGIIDRLLKEIGLFNDDISATSVRLWRLMTTLTNADAKAAQELGGYGEEKDDEDRLWRTLGFLEKPRTDDEDDEEEPESFL